MIKAISTEVEQMLHGLCKAKSIHIGMQGIEGSASKQLEIRAIADRIIDYALDPKTAPGIIEVAFVKKQIKSIEDVYKQSPVTVTFPNFISQDKVNKNTLLVKHLLVIVNWSTSIKIFKATIENEYVHLVLYSKSE